MLTRFYIYSKDENGNEHVEDILESSKPTTKAGKFISVIQDRINHAIENGLKVVIKSKRR